jgi:hypothetical protein
MYSISAYLSVITIPPGTIYPKKAMLLKILAELVQGLSNMYFQLDINISTNKKAKITVAQRSADGEIYATKPEERGRGKKGVQKKERLLQGRSGDLWSCDRKS